MREYFVDLVAPLDHRDPIFSELTEAKIKRLGHGVQPVHVKVVQYQPSLVTIGQGKRWAGDPIPDAKPMAKALSEAGFARAKIPGQNQEIPVN